jgi:cytochrome P450 family 135
MARMASSAASSLPPGPRLPSPLQALLLNLVPLRFMEASCRRYGDIVTFRGLFGRPWVLVFHPAQVKQVFRAPEHRLTNDKFMEPRLSPVLGKRSIVLREGPEHMRSRRTIRPALQGESLREYEMWVRDATDRMIDSWPVGEPFALLPWTSSLAVDMSTRVILGSDEQSKRQEISAQMKELMDPKLTVLGRVGHALTRGKLRSGSNRHVDKQRRVVDHLLREVIADRRAAPDLEQRSDVLSALLTAHDEDGRAMSDQEVCDHVVNLLLGGRINLSAAIAWSFDLLLRNPAVLRRLREELAAGDESYLDAAVKETLRIRSMSLTPVSRFVIEQPFRLGDHLLQPGTHLSLGAAVIHRRPDIYPEPHVFRPERFLGPQRAYMYAWIPFGGGTRRCPGANFSMMEMAVVIRRVLERTHLEPVGRRPEKRAPKGTTLRVVTYVPARGTPVIQVRSPEPVAPEARAKVPDAA